MGKLKKPVLDGTRRDYWYMDPEKLVLVTDKDHPLYDPRVEGPPEERLVRNIMKFGVKNPIQVRKNGTIPEVVAGRQRVKAIREANRRLEEAGFTKKQIPVIPEKGTDRDMYGIMILENELRREDNPLTKAKKALTLYNMGANEQEIADTFGVCEQTVQNWLNLNDLSDTVQNAIESGEISASAASELLELEREEQDKVFEELKAEEGNVSASKVREKIRGEPKKPKLRPRKEIERTIEIVSNQSGERAQGFLEALQWLLGGESSIVPQDGPNDSEAQTEDGDGGLFGAFNGDEEHV